MLAVLLGDLTQARADGEMAIRLRAGYPLPVVAVLTLEDARTGEPPAAQSRAARFSRSAEPRVHSRTHCAVLQAGGKKTTAAPSGTDGAAVDSGNALLQAERHSGRDRQEADRSAGLLHPQVAPFDEEPRGACAERRAEAAAERELGL